MIAASVAVLAQAVSEESLPVKYLERSPLMASQSFCFAVSGGVYLAMSVPSSIVAKASWPFLRWM